MARYPFAALALFIVASTAHPSAQTPLVTPVLSTAPLFNYEDAPATPDADDPAIWVDRHRPGQALVIGTAKDAGILVYDLQGRLRQAIAPDYRRRVLPADPPTPAGIDLEPDRACPESESGDIFGRFNNVDIAYDVRLGPWPWSPKADVAIVSDRGCDRVRFFRIDGTSADAPLTDITDAGVPRVFPFRYDQPSPLQPSGAIAGWRDNPVDDQNTVYGLTVAQGPAPTVFVTERERGLVRQLQVIATPQGRLTYATTRTFLFDTSFDLKDERGRRYRWTPCREAALEEPQAEGVVYDGVNDVLFVGFETIGLYRLPLRGLPPLVRVGRDQLIEPLTDFGRPWRATPDDDEFECEYEPEGDPSDGDIDATGSPVHAGRFLAADLEGVSVVASVRGRTLLIVSSQGDSSFHFYSVDKRSAVHEGVFFIDGVGETDGVHYVPVPLGPRYPLGLLVVQNGAAPEPDDTGEVNGYEFDGSTQFVYVNFLDALTAVWR